MKTWADLTESQRWALTLMLDVELGIAGGVTTRVTRDSFLSGSRKKIAHDRRRGTQTLKSLEVLGLAKSWAGCDTVYALTDAGRKLVTDAVRAEKKARNAKTTASGRIVDADRDFRRMVWNIPRPPKG